MEKMHRCEGYVEALEEERRKIQVFHRELPLCLELVTQAISTCRRQLTTTVEYFPERSECSEQTSSEGPVFEEFIPIKRSSSSEEQESPKNKERDDKAGKKTDWLRSVQLWNQDPDPSPKQDQSRKTPVIETKKTGGAFHPFQQDKGVTSAVTIPSPAQTAAASSSADTTNGRSRIEEKEGQSQRKQRRSWSPELHRRFLHALQELGGAHVATPKQIRELMKVDGLSNDEVKSHLQKYRLHTKRPNSAAHNNASPQPPQFVVVGGIWVPPEYAAMAATTRETNGGVAAKGIYAPLAAPPQLPPALMLCSQQQQQEQKQSPQSHSHSEERCFHSGDDNTHSNSPATSSSTHTTTASPAF